MLDKTVETIHPLVFRHRRQIITCDKSRFTPGFCVEVAAHTSRDLGRHAVVDCTRVRLDAPVCIHRLPVGRQRPCCASLLSQSLFAHREDCGEG